ncbi:FAD/NAD(P)-binding protein [Streptomyces sp. V4-01]|uniref:FAD/NAD(P)-binding protein n=1 Tax=Actinacidiphila polyblastidii TaxID=3110430 RepID=A0ABU7PIB2_9ACTN|nr:FAD/NAD(P)-binding protein [Streptomyces sp. V4-01]
MRPSSTGRRVVVVGAGAAGVLVAAHLLRDAGNRHGPRVTLVDPGPRPGPGIAYATREPRHLLNVPAGRMGAFAEEPGGFTAFLAARGLPCDPGAFVPRALYGDYLEDVLRAAARATADRARLSHLRASAVRVGRAGAGFTVALADGRRIGADALVLATGAGAPRVGWAPAGLRGSPAFVADPWAPGALGAVPPSADVLVVGTGLTMADTALHLARRGRVVHAVSRHGLLPHAHAAVPAAAVPPPPVAEPVELAALRRAVLRHAARCRRERGDWRAGLDGWRSVTARLWQCLSTEDQATFLSGDRALWDVHRHRLPPACADALDAACAAGTVAVRRGEVTGVRPDGAGLAVRLSDGRTLTVGAVVNCAGAEPAAARSPDPLLRSALADGLVRPGPHGIGLATDGTGRLLPAVAGSGPQPAWTLGAPRRGSLLESTAIPEIRAQAAAVAAAVTAAVTVLPAASRAVPPPAAALPRPLPRPAATPT